MPRDFRESLMSSVTAIQEPKLQNYVNGAWRPSTTTEYVEVINPATAEVLTRTPLSTDADVDSAVQTAAEAFPVWRRTPPGERIQYLFKLKNLLEEHLDELAKLITLENGKTFGEAKAELRRGIENVEVACGIPMMMQGYNLEDVTPGVDETMIRQPLGVVAAITPFNFPAMIPFWFLPYAIACGNTFVLKPSERVPLTMRRAMELIERTGIPKGVVNLVNGGRAAVDALCDHPNVRAISFVGSTPVAKHVYARAAVSGKRMQCQGGAKNHVIVLPDADMDLATQIIGDSAFGCAGQRCLAVSVAVTIGEAQKTFRDSIAHAASAIRVGNGLDSGVQMGPVITRESKQRIESLIGKGVAEGAKAIVEAEPGAREFDGRSDGISGAQSVWESGFALYHQRVRGAAIPLRSARRKYRDQYRRGGADGILPFQRMEGELLRYFARARPRRRGVLHGIESGDRALVAAGNAKILAT